MHTVNLIQRQLWHGFFDLQADLTCQFSFALTLVVMHSFKHIFLLWLSALGILSIANASPVSMHIETLLQVRGHKG